MPPNTRFIRPTKCSLLRAKANNLKFSSGRSVSNGSIWSMPSQLKHAESCSASLHDCVSLPERTLSKIPQPKQKTLAPAATPRKSRQQVLTQNRVRALETQYQTLQCLQSAFYEKLQSLGPVESKMLGSYKFVAIVLREDSKWVHNNEQLIPGPPQKLPSDSVQDLKNRCQAAVDSGFMMLYDHLEHIQLAKDELEACNQKEQLAVKLKELLQPQMDSIFESIEQMCVTPVSQQVSPNKHLYRRINGLSEEKQDLETRLLDVNNSHSDQINILKADQTLGELRDMLQLCEAQHNEDLGELAKQNESLAAKDNTIASMRTDMDNLMSRNVGLELQMKEAEASVVQAQKDVERKSELIDCLEEELKDKRQLVAQLPRGEDSTSQVVVEKDQIIRDLNLKLLTCMQFKEMLLRQFEDIRKLQADNERLDRNIQKTRTEISELQEIMKSTELQLDSSYQREQQLSLHLEHVKSELLRSEQLVAQLRGEANAVHNATSTPNGENLKQTQTENQQKMEEIIIKHAEDPDVNQLSCQLESRDEQLRHVFGKLSSMQEKLTSMEESIKQINDPNYRLSQLRDGQREKELLMEREISQFMDGIKVYEDHISISISRRSEQPTHPKRCCCVNNFRQGNFQLHGNYFRPLHGHLAQEQPTQRPPDRDSISSGNIFSGRHSNGQEWQH